jgi:hypothetical protein
LYWNFHLLQQLGRKKVEGRLGLFVYLLASFKHAVREVRSLAQALEIMIWKMKIKTYRTALAPGGLVAE